MKKTVRKTKTTPVKTTGKPAGSTGTGSSSTNAKVEMDASPSLTEIKELIELVKELIELVSEKQLNEFELERGNFRLHLQTGLSAPAVELNQRAPHVPQPAAAIRPSEVVTTPPAAQPAPAPPEEKLHIVTSPIVGTFYRSASPTAEPFVKLGYAVEAGKTLCIIEAMKLMNEIQSDASGTIAKIFVENGQPVEYGQQLFGIKI